MLPLYWHWYIKFCWDIGLTVTRKRNPKRCSNSLFLSLFLFLIKIQFEKLSTHTFTMFFGVFLFCLDFLLLVLIDTEKGLLIL